MVRKILIVEDFEPFRTFILSVVQSNGDGHRVHEASDGLQAVRYASDHKPDLVLLDIGLPGLNGIAAARQIRELSPNSKILFVSQESSLDIIREALALGALGYVLKLDVVIELLRAIDAVMEGRTYVGSSLPQTANAVSRVN